jgi:GT2 family glycosyltransferase
VLFLNPDGVLHPDTVARTLRHVAADATIGVLGCRTLNADGTPQPTVDRFHTVAGLVAEALGARRGVASGPRGRVPATTEDVDWVYGSFLLCRREALLAVGGFDEAYEMYGEDLDLCHRVRAAGFRVVYFADAAFTHRGNRSGARRYGAHRDAAVLKGTLRFFRRRRGRAAERAFRALAAPAFAAKALLCAARAAIGGDAFQERSRVYAELAWLCVTGDRGRDAAPPRTAAPAGVAPREAAR